MENDLRSQKPYFMHASEKTKRKRKRKKQHRERKEKKKKEAIQRKEEKKKRDESTRYGMRHETAVHYGNQGSVG